MERVFTQDVVRKDGSKFADKGEVRDYPMDTWMGIGKSINAKDPRKGMAKISRPIDELGNLITKSKRAA